MYSLVSTPPTQSLPTPPPHSPLRPTFPSPGGDNNNDHSEQRDFFLNGWRRRNNRNIRLRINEAARDEAPPPPPTILPPPPSPHVSIREFCILYSVVIVAVQE